MNPRIIFVLSSLAICASLVIGCQQHLTIEINDAVPTTFKFHADSLTHYKHLTFFIVIEIPPENQKLPAYEKTAVENKAVWWVFPNDSEKGDFENLPTFTYGKIPAGWNQTVPKEGEPPPLVEGRVYEAGGPQIEVPWAHMRFTIRNGKAVRLPLYRDEFEKRKDEDD